MRIKLKKLTGIASLKAGYFDLHEEFRVTLNALLTDAGFNMSGIKFQSNARGRIIVSDGKKAALLEFSGLP